MERNVKVLLFVASLRSNFDSARHTIDPAIAESDEREPLQKIAAKSGVRGRDL
jgi:hypothetical protein